MPQNTTKNIFISLALIFFIVSSGAFTIYQLAKRQTKIVDNLQSIQPIINQSSSSLTASSTVSKELEISFNTYVCGISLTGVVNKPDIIQKLDFVLVNKEKSEITQSFTPKIDEAKNFKLLIDDKLLVDGVYKLEARAILNSQKSENTETTIEFKKDCTKLVQSSTASSSILSESVFSSSKVKDLALTVIPSSSSTVSSVVTPISSLIAENVNPNAVRTGGLDYKSIVALSTILIGLIILAKVKSKRFTLNQVFGKK